MNGYECAQQAERMQKALVVNALGPRSAPGSASGTSQSKTCRGCGANDHTIRKCPFRLQANTPSPAQLAAAQGRQQSRATCSLPSDDGDDGDAYTPPPVHPVLNFLSLNDDDDIHILWQATLTPQYATRVEPVSEGQLLYFAIGSSTSMASIVVPGLLPMHCTLQCFCPDGHRGRRSWRVVPENFSEVDTGMNVRIGNASGPCPCRTAGIAYALVPNAMFYIGNFRVELKDSDMSMQMDGAALSALNTPASGAVLRPDPVVGPSSASFDPHTETIEYFDLLDNMDIAYHIFGLLVAEAELRSSCAVLYV